MYVKWPKVLCKYVCVYGICNIYIYIHVCINSIINCVCVSVYLYTYVLYYQDHYSTNENSFMHDRLRQKRADQRIWISTSSAVGRILVNASSYFSLLWLGSKTLLVSNRRKIKKKIIKSLVDPHIQHSCSRRVRGVWGTTIILTY